jgi:hypothetical protein
MEDYKLRDLRASHTRKTRESFFLEKRKSRKENKLTANVDSTGRKQAHGNLRGDVGSQPV